LIQRQIKNEKKQIEIENTRKFLFQRVVCQLKPKKLTQKTLYQIEEESQLFLVQKILDQRQEKHKSILNQIEREHQKFLHALQRKNQFEKDICLITFNKIEEKNQEFLLQRIQRQRKKKHMNILNQLEEEYKNIFYDKKQQALFVLIEKERILHEKEQELIKFYQIDEEYLHTLFQRVLRQREQKHFYILSQIETKNKSIIVQKREKEKKQILKQIDEKRLQHIFQRVFNQRLERHKRTLDQIEEECKLKMKKNNLVNQQIVFRDVLRKKYQKNLLQRILRQRQKRHKIILEKIEKEHEHLLYQRVLSQRSLIQHQLDKENQQILDQIEKENKQFLLDISNQN